MQFIARVPSVVNPDILTEGTALEEATATKSDVHLRTLTTAPPDEQVDAAVLVQGREDPLKELRSRSEIINSCLQLPTYRYLEPERITEVDRIAIGEAVEVEATREPDRVFLGKCPDSLPGPDPPCRCRNVLSLPPAGTPLALSFPGGCASPFHAHGLPRLGLWARSIPRRPSVWPATGRRCSPASTSRRSTGSTCGPRTPWSPRLPPCGCGSG